jgi:hypothetical protein
MTESKECRLCHRIGYRGFVPYGDWAWCCSRDDLCRERRARQIRAAVRELGVLA